jgi:hypothetical protein
LSFPPRASAAAALAAFLRFPPAWAQIPGPVLDMVKIEGGTFGA